ncbi:MAG: phosphate ABC transporter substrate-binding protein PstS [Nitrosopumilales archaeon]|nr:MAG: phosphate ABC transporter substrate-binding protein PstS [Nitrosopumilales archaeon]
MTKKLLLGLALMLILIIPTTSLSAHAATVPDVPADGKTFQFTGAGSSFAFPIVDKWRVEYNKIYPSVSLNYQPIGSGAGINLFTKKTVDFGATDAPLTKDEAKKAPDALTIPETIGAVVVVYKLPEFPNSGLKLTAKVIADIYMGKISTWNDPQIQKLNPGVKFSKNKIVLVHRSDGSGTTYTFTDYLSGADREWAGAVGKGKSVPWRSGVGASGNAGVANTVKNVPYSLGYVELAYAIQNKMSYAYIKNADGTAFVEPTLDSTKVAATALASKLPEADADWSNVSIVNAQGKDAYPISTFSYLLVYKDLDKVKNMDKNKAKAEIHLIYWMITDGQKYASKLTYVPLPDAVQEVDKRGLAKIKFQGEQLFDYTH